MGLTSGVLQRLGGQQPGGEKWTLRASESSLISWTHGGGGRPLFVCLTGLRLCRGSHHEISLWLFLEIWV